MSKKRRNVSNNKKEGVENMNNDAEASEVTEATEPENMNNIEEETATGGTGQETPEGEDSQVAEEAETPPGGEPRKRGRGGFRVRPVMTFKNLTDLRDSMDAEPELPIEDRAVGSKMEALGFLKDQLKALLGKGYTHSAIAEYLNKNQDSYTFYPSEIKKVLTPPTPPRKKSPRAKIAEYAKEAEHGEPENAQ